jgi:hypothetical protein
MTIKFYGWLMAALIALSVTAQAQTQPQAKKNDNSSVADELKRMDFSIGFSWRRAAFGVNDKTAILNVVALRNQLNKTEDFGKGFTAAATYNFGKYVGAKVDFAFNANTRNLFVGSNNTRLLLRERLTTILGGIETKDNTKKRGFRPFAHALAGVALARTRTPQAACGAAFGANAACPARLNDTNFGLAAALGVGVDVKLSRGFALRLLQVDYLPMRINGRTNHGVRMSAGLVF